MKGDVNKYLHWKKRNGTKMRSLRVSVKVNLARVIVDGGLFSGAIETIYIN